MLFYVNWLVNLSIISREILKLKILSGKFKYKFCIENQNVIRFDFKMLYV